jgi:hypothetical protein
MAVAYDHCLSTRATDDLAHVRGEDLADVPSHLRTTPYGPMPAAKRALARAARTGCRTPPAMLYGSYHVV